MKNQMTTDEKWTELFQRLADQSLGVCREWQGHLRQYERLSDALRDLPDSTRWNTVCPYTAREWLEETFNWVSVVKPKVCKDWPVYSSDLAAAYVKRLHFTKAEVRSIVRHVRAQLKEAEMNDE